MSDSRAQFGTKLGVIATTVGSAVGLGNIWRFPYEAGSHGGGPSPPQSSQSAPMGVDRIHGNSGFYSHPVLLFGGCRMDIGVFCAVGRSGSD